VAIRKSERSGLDGASSAVAIGDAFHRRQARAAFLLATLAITLDGFDNQLLGVIVPALMREWGVDRSAFIPIIGASLAAMSIGTAIAGYAGDRFGRRRLLIGNVALFGAATLLSALSRDLWILGAVRCLAALGLGGAMPNATALLAEHASPARRNMAVTCGVVCVPLGGLLSGGVAALVLPGLGWRAMMVIGGIVPLLGAVVMLRFLPQSPRSITVRHQAGHRGALAREAASRQGVFARGWRLDTLVVWTAFFFCLLAVYSMFNWAPTMMSGSGYDLRIASVALAVFNLGGVVGALIGAVLMDWFGSRWPMIGMALGGVLFSLLASAIVGQQGSQSALLTIFVCQGAFIAGLQVMLFALAAGIYPAALRASGIGAALAVGRLGAVVSSVAGAAALTRGATGFLQFVAAAMLIAGIALFVLRRNLARVVKRPERSAPCV